MPGMILRKGRVNESSHVLQDCTGTPAIPGRIPNFPGKIFRAFGSWPGDRNRWGDYTGMSLDPTDDNVFWAFNQYAMTRGTGTAPEDCMWGTAWASLIYVFVVDTHTPAPNARSVPTGSTIQVTFNDHVDDTTLDANTTFNVDGSMSGEHLGGFSGGGTRFITFDPTHNFKPGEVVTVTK